MKNYQRFTGRVVFLALTGIMLCGISRAQFTISDDFKGNGNPDIVLGGPEGPGQGPGAAYLTSGIDDPAGSGWLRLTRDMQNQQGFAYIDRSFPSGMGVEIDFEYKIWRSRHDPVQGADGLSVFLFDAAAGFRLGGFGGSLGYAPGYPDVPQGLAGGYIGVGFDAYGNFSNPSEWRVGGPGEQPNAVVLRGPTTADPGTTNRYLQGTRLGIRSGSHNDIRQRDEIDYNTVSAQRPDDREFYRRVQITVLPVTAGNGDTRYEVTVRWSRAQGERFEELLREVIDDPPPALMKVGFAASTGSGFNYHEIRNMTVTTVGNLRVVKSADRDYLVPEDEGGPAGSEITYTIEVVNDTGVPISNIRLADTLMDAHGAVLDPAVFRIDAVEVLDAELTVDWEDAGNNVLAGTATIQANSTGRIRVKGRLLSPPAGNAVINSVMLHPPAGTDADLLNNAFSVTTPVRTETRGSIAGSLTADTACIDREDGNVLTLKLSNAGRRDIRLQPDGTVTVVITHPQEVSLTPLDHGGWDYEPIDERTHKFLLMRPTDPFIRPGSYHPDSIRFRIIPLAHTAGYPVHAEITLDNGDGAGHAAAVSASMRPCDPDLLIPNALTPNGDGKNDRFIIRGLEQYERADLTVFNRWGTEVYRNRNYRQDWDGGGLSEGTYYYRLLLFSGGAQTVHKGWVLIKRE